MFNATFKNIGPIKGAELDLGDLTIIAGQNNTGKTYLVYALYGFLKFMESKGFYDLNLLGGRMLSNGEVVDDSSSLVKRLARDLGADGSASIDIDEYGHLKNKAVKRAAEIFSRREYLSEVFSSPHVEFEEAQFDLKVSHENDAISRRLRFGVRDSARVILESSLEEGRLVLKLRSISNEQTTELRLDRAVSALLRNIIRANFPDAFILSAERFGISLFYKELDFTKNRIVEMLQNSSNTEDVNLHRLVEKASARYAKSIKDNIDFTRDLERITKSKSDLLLGSYAYSVKNIMGGSYKVANDEIRFVSKKRGEGRFDIPLHLASSSARGLSDLYFYIKHIAKKGQLLIIDEPESHLSPTNQILMARLLVFCVNNGLKVLITTHSDYLIKEINNLIMLHGDFESKDAFLQRHKRDYTEEDYLNPESVKAYACEKGGLSSCDVGGMGIDMPVFDNAIDRINRISNELGALKNWGGSEDD